jgi:hypothetical protein
VVRTEGLAAVFLVRRGNGIKIFLNTTVIGWNRAKCKAVNLRLKGI